MLIVLQWNARSIILNGLEFKKFIDDLDQKPQIICVQESWLKPHLKLGLYGCWPNVRKVVRTANRKR